MHIRKYTKAGWQPVVKGSTPTLLGPSSLDGFRFQVEDTDGKLANVITNANELRAMLAAIEALEATR